MNFAQFCIRKSFGGSLRSTSSSFALFSVLAAPATRLNAGESLTRTTRASPRSRFLSLICGSWGANMSVLDPRLIVGTNYIQVRNAGHSKWANIKHTKMTKDLEKARESAKYCQAIRVAIKECKNADPKTNKALSDAIDRAREAKIPTATITKVVDATKNPKDLKNVLWYFKGPGRSVFLVEIMTDHLARCKGEIGAIIKRFATWADEGVMYQFMYKGIIVCSALDGQPLTENLLDTSTDHAIDVEAEEVSLQTHPKFGTVFEFISESENFHKVKHGLLKLNYTILESDLHYIPTSPVALNEGELDSATKLCDKLLNHAEVLRVSDNIGA